MRNWGGNHTYRGAGRLHRPATLDEAREIVAAAPRLRVLGSRHSFSDLADSAELLSLDALPADIVVDHAAGTVALGGAVTYGALAAALNAEGVALGNLASLPHISVAGAIATATHGSGDANGNLATAVRALQLITSDGELLTAQRGDPDFDGLVVGLGALGAVTRVTLDVEPAYAVRQRVFEGLAWDTLADHFDAVTASGYSVSLFTLLGDAVDQVWVKTRITEPSPDPSARPDLFGARAATAERHPIAGMDPINCTPQLGAPGPWSDRLPHFRMGFTPSAGAEIQSEYHVPRRHALAAIAAVRGLAGAIRPLLQVCEIRTIAADELWLSPQHRRDAVALHFTWRRDQPAVERVLAGIEAALAPFDARPHWGKAFLMQAPTIGALYARLPDFAALVDRLDPRGAFRNDWLERHVLGAS
ncbi:MAG TPA: D-arabinono-1,4-lactone oxidase [Baekduia sp.]